MDDTPNLALPYLAAAQAQKHVTHNEALRMLDAVVQLVVADRTLTAPPSSPPEGERHIVGAAATGAWAGKDGQVAMWRDGAWGSAAPRPGWTAFSLADGAMVVRGSSTWAPLMPRAPGFTVAALPSAATAGAGALAYVSNESGGAVLAFSDGAAWRRVTDRATVS